MKQCKYCKEYFAFFSCAKDRIGYTGECDCPKCQGLCECIKPGEGEAYARSTDPETSHEAAEGIEGEQAAKYERRALAAFAQEPVRGLTNIELVHATGIEWNAITPRVAPLRRRKLIEFRIDPATLKPQTRMGHKGKPQRIHWIKSKS